MSTEVIIPEIETLAIKEQIAPDGVAALHAAFAPHFQSFAALYPDAREVQADQPKKARALRLKVRAVRIASDDTRKEMKADSLRRSRAIDGCHAILMQSLVPVDEALDKIEKAEELRDAARKNALKIERVAQLSPYTTNPELFALADMPDMQFAELLSGMKSAHAARIADAEAAAKVEQERVRAEEAERVRIVTENARLAKLADDERRERERVEAAASAERAAHDAKIAAERAEAARLAKIESDKRDAAEKERREQERKARAEADAKAQAALAKERAERERIQAEMRASLKADEDRVAAERAAAKRAAAAPDREKVRAFADRLAALGVPELSDDVTAARISEQMGAAYRWLINLSTKIGE